jgi:hypothetical protein
VVKECWSEKCVSWYCHNKFGSTSMFPAVVLFVESGVDEQSLYSQCM